ncbi:MAG TPA: hypothetical protein PLO37_09765 [Candidatus Hydrogenedentes bacterium]|nr:hypothetical protein [Candidatus Hydrogenedentota bacterium]HPG67119.1 hypothetical protein [Candidatus Hydrogenedentota bacterium]
MGDGPDRYIEVVRFFPARDRKSFEIIMFLAPYKNDSKNGGGDLSECVGSKATGNWEDIKSLIGKAFAMSRHRTGILAGVPQDNMVRTIVLPRDAMDVHRGLKADRVETCLAGSVQSVAGLAAECGEYNHVESWTNRAQLAGINGNVYWWGRIGVAEGGNGAISHVLVRSYPSEKH